MSFRLPVALALLGALALAACGVKGPLEPPETEHQTPAPGARAPMQGGQQTSGGLVTTPGAPGSSTSQPARATADPASNKPFFLDFLL